MRNESPVTNWEPSMSEKGLDESYAAIREALEKNNRGNVVNSLQNCVLALTHDPLLGGHIRRNLFNERLTIDCPLPWVRESSVISDTDPAFLQLHLERHYGLKAERCLPGALKIAATDNAFHPVRDRLRALRWDGVPRVRNALHHFLGAEVNDYHDRCLRTFMLGAVKRVFQPGCKFELVLVGVQGVFCANVGGNHGAVRFRGVHHLSVQGGGSHAPGSSRKPDSRPWRDGLSRRRL